MPTTRQLHTARRTTALVAALTFAIAAASAVSTATTAAGAPAPTKRLIFFPFRGSVLAPHIAIDATRRGKCDFGSAIVTRWDAWSCTAGGRVYDPCFSSTRTETGAIVACLPSPWANTTLIELTRPLPLDLSHVTGDPRRHTPWAVVLGTGERCHLTATRLGSIAGVPVSYVCAGAAVLTGLPRRVSPRWTILRAATAKARMTRRVAIRRAWW
jgi:hypothetical protein